MVEDGRLAPTGEGTPQGGVISPALMNVALHGMEEAAGVRYWEGGTLRAVPGSPVLVRYADDVLALCHTREQAEHVKQRLARWLEPRGLVFNEAKTRITHLDHGVDFLGFEIRRYRGKLLTKPSKDALRRIRKRLSEEVTALRGANANAVIAKLNPIITGSPGVPSLSHDVAPEAPRRALQHTSRGEVLVVDAGLTLVVSGRGVWCNTCGVTTCC